MIMITHDAITAYATLGLLVVAIVSLCINKRK